jgi:hypothetical protein
MGEKGRMEERTLLTNSCFVIPMRERLGILIRRVVFIPYLFFRYKMRRLLPTNMTEPGDVLRSYVRDHEAGRVLANLGIRERDATAAVKVATYMHNLTHPIGRITEMEPERSVRVEEHCPFSRFLAPEICRNIISGPAFEGVCEAIHPDLTHAHGSYLSGGEDCCDLVFEQRSE